MCRTGLLRLFLTSCVTFALVLAGGPSRAADNKQVDVELVLATDISYSMDYDELVLQREGYALAIRSEQFIDALLRGPIGRIAVTFVEWAGWNEQLVVIPWHLIDGPDSADAFAEKLKAAEIRRARRTSISGALKFSAALFGTEFKGLRRVIDISGDGTNNDGELVEPMRDEVVRQGITINGLPLMLKEPFTTMIDIPDLDVYYTDCVIGGPGAFVIPVRDRIQFPGAIRNKLLLEVAGIAPRKRALGEQLLVPVSDKPRVSCTIGEQMWQRRWGGGP
jgi:hypothetical protein